MSNSNSFENFHSNILKLILLNAHKKFHFEWLSQKINKYEHFHHFFGEDEFCFKINCPSKAQFIILNGTIKLRSFSDSSKRNKKQNHLLGKNITKRERQNVQL